VTLAAGADWETALRMANAAAAVAVSKKGTAVVASAELRRKILPHAFLAAEEKIIATSSDDKYLLDWRKQGLRVGFANGGFDIIRPGHVKVLTAARGACVIVGLNSDASVMRKGEGRPVHNERARSEVLAVVVIFEEDTPLNLITHMKPSVLVKSGGYAREQVIGHEVVSANGGEIEGFSTTSHVRRARESHQ
jgi:D-beta-D-heptose 7-phosphate kinase/D-beta-D-heptose 1-phosphate adenosyltransferase